MSASWIHPALTYKLVVQVIIPFWTFMENGGLILIFEVSSVLYFVNLIGYFKYGNTMNNSWRTVQKFYRKATRSFKIAYVKGKCHLMWWYELHELNLTRPRYSDNIKLKNWKCCCAYYKHRHARRARVKIVEPEN